MFMHNQIRKKQLKMQNLSLLKTSEDQQLKSNVFKEITSCCRYSVFKTWGHQHVCGCSSFTFHYWRGVRTANYFLRVPTYFQKHTGQFEHRTCLATKNNSVWVKKQNEQENIKTTCFCFRMNAVQCNDFLFQMTENKQEVKNTSWEQGGSFKTTHTNTLLGAEDTGG